MNVRRLRSFATVITGALVLTCLVFAAPLRAQVEHEPNDPCPSAQGFGIIPLPFHLNGNLDVSIDPDVDFYRIRAVPGSRLAITLQGELSGHGTLYNPYLGTFDANCNLLASNDNSYDDNGDYTYDSRLDVTVPPNGQLILGATECCDSNFQGADEGGTYQLSVSVSTIVDSIRGRLADAQTGVGIPGYPYDGSVTLRLCQTGDCSAYTEVRNMNSEDDGTFVFTNDDYGPRLEAGRYQIAATAVTYADYLGEPFDVATGQAYDAGDLRMAAMPRIVAIRGRAVDAVTGEPLTGDYYSNVSLSFCTDYCDYISSSDLGPDGTFEFVSQFNGVPLVAGTYDVTVSADEYYEVDTGQFAVPAGADYDLGDIALQAQTVGFSDYVPCTIPREGGLCQFTVKVSNRLHSGLFGGKAWIIVDGNGIGSIVDSTTFQLDHVGQVNLAPGESRIVPFAFYVPTTVDNGSYICVRIYAGEATPNVYFGTEGSKDLFCINKGYDAFVPVPAQRARMLFDRIHGRGVMVAPQRARGAKAHTGDAALRTPR